MNFTKLTVITALLAATNAPLAASAQDAGVYLGGSLGRSTTNNDLAGATAITSNDEKGDGWKLFGGYQINKNFGVEATYVDMGNFGASGRIGVVPFTFSAKANGYALAAVGTLPVSASFDLFAKVGVVFSKVKSSGTAGAVFVGSNDRETDWTAGIGVKYNVNKNFAIRAEAERYERNNRPNAANRAEETLRTSLWQSGTRRC